MTKDDEIAELWELAITKAKGWQHQDCPVVRGDYGDLERAWNTITAGKTEQQRQDMLNKIKLAIPEQARARKLDRNNNEKPPQPKLIGAYLRAKRWMDDIGSIQERQQKQQPLASCQCGREVIGPSYKDCDYCYSMRIGATVNLMRDYCRDRDLHHKSREELMAMTKQLAARVGK